MYMPDCIKGTIDLMDADIEDLSVHSSYNVAGMSFTPKQLSAEIKKHLPDFEITYQPDFRQAIADSWPACIDDEVAKKDWGLHYQFDIEKLTKVMLQGIREKLS